MKIKNGKAKLEAGEVRIGNYFIKGEKEHVKVADLNAIFTYRVNRGIPIGIFLSQTVDEIKGGSSDHERGIGNYLAVMWAVMATVPDVEFLETIYLAAEDCMKRHPEAYGVKGEATDEEQAKAESEYKEMMAFEEDVKNMPDDGDTETR